MFDIVFQTFAVVILFVKLSFVFVVGKILVRLSCARKMVIKAMHEIASVPLPKELYWASLFSWPMMQSLWQQGALDIRKTATQGKPTPDPLLVDPNTGDEIKLSKTLSVQKPHVLAFGSYSCPVLRLKLNQFKSIAKELHNLAEFSFIYIDEAHPADGWAFKDDVEIFKHQIIEDRLNAARMFCAFSGVEAASVRVLTDSMKNEAGRMFGVNSIRLYVVQNETVLYEGGIGPTYYRLDDVKQVIINACGSI